MRNLLVAAVVGASLWTPRAAPALEDNGGYVISEVVARQRWPWERKVDIDFQLTKPAWASSDQVVRIGVVASNDTREVAVSYAALAGTAALPGGCRRIVWDPTLDHPNRFFPELKFYLSVISTNVEPDYLVINLVDGDIEYKDEYFAEEVNADLYKTEKIFAFFDPSGIISCLSDWELKPSKMFVISGTYDTSIGIESAFITYSINDQSMANPQTAAVTLNEDGTFVCNIPFTNVNDKLTYKLTVVRGGVNIEYNGGTKFPVELTEGRITYTWIGNTETSSNNYWKNLENWDFGDGSKYGYPGETSGGYYVAVANFTKNADVDLNGEAVYLLDNNRGFEMSEGITVKLKNGTLGFQPHNDGNPVTLNLGKKNSTLHLKDVEMPYNNEEIYDKTKGRYKEYDVMLVADSTVIVEGNQEYIWRFYPGNARTKFKVANGIMQMKHRKKQPGADSEVEISNAVWVLSTCIQTAEGFPIESCQYGLAMKTIFRDGPDRQAQLIFREKHTSGMYYNLKLVGTYDFKPSNKTKATYTVAPYLIAGGLSTSDACTISVDVSDLEGRARIPLMEFKTVDSNVTTAMNTMVNNPDKLIVTANGKNVKNRQRARLEWDETAKTLYYEQDPIKGFRVIVR